jgi:hypothetical protein
MRKILLIVIFILISFLLLVLTLEFYQRNTLNISEKTIELEEECTAVMVTGTHAKDGRSILMKNRDWSDTQYQKPYFYSSYAGGNYSYILMSAYMGMNEAGLAIMNTLQSSGLKNWQYNVHGNYTNDKSVAMQYVLSHFSDVEKAVMWLIDNTYGLCDCIGIIGQNSSIGAFVWIDGDHKYITWVNNSHDAAANNWVPDGVYGSRGARAKALLDQIYSEKGYISWEDVVQEISRDQYDREKTNNNCYSYSDCISRDITRANMVAVSGNNSYDGRLNIMWLNFGENSQIGLFLPLMPGVIDSSSDIPSIFRDGNGLGALVEVKRNYARDGCGPAQWNGTRVREIHNYSLYAESYTFKKYDELLDTIPSGLSYSELKTLLKNYMNDSITFATNIYISEKISGDFPPTCSISSIIETSNYAYKSGNSLWYNTANSGNFIINIAASDDLGITKVNFPNTVSLGGDDSTSPYSWSYDWDASDTYSGTATVTVYDTSNQTGTCIFTLTRDVIPPITTASVSGSYLISLACTDTGAGCNKTYYCIDTTNNCTPTNQYTSSITTSCSGICYVRYYSLDYVSNMESIKSTQFGSSVTPKALVMYYTFNESSGGLAHDYSGFNNHGNIFGPIWTNGKHDSALQFDGIDDYIEVPHSSYLAGFSSGFTASFWIKFNDTIRRQAILNKYDTTNNQRSWFIEYQNHSAYGKVLGFFASNNGANYSEWYANFTPQKGQWYHITIVWKTNEIPKFYVNGQLIPTIGNNTISQIYNNTLAPLHIGKSTYTPGREFNGFIDELKVYNFGLNSTEVNSIYLDESRNYFTGKLLDKNGNPIQATIFVDSQSTETNNGNYILKINTGTYDVKYNFTNIPISNFWIKLLSFNISSDYRDLINYIDYGKNISFTINAINNQTVQVYSNSKPNKIKLNDTAIQYDDSLSIIPSWNFNDTTKIITFKFSC